MTFISTYWKSFCWVEFSNKKKKFWNISREFFSSRPCENYNEKSPTEIVRNLIKISKKRKLLAFRSAYIKAFPNTISTENPPFNGVFVRMLLFKLFKKLFVNFPECLSHNIHIDNEDLISSVTSKSVCIYTMKHVSKDNLCWFSA